MSRVTSCDMRKALAEHGGVLKSGAHHKEAGECCILELRSACLGLKWTDNPAAVGRPDIRPLNDATWSSDEARTAAMLLLDAALEPWATWSEAQRLAYVRRVVVWTVQNLIADLPGLPDIVREQCRSSTDIESARVAAKVAEASAKVAEASAWVAEASAWVAEASEASARVARTADADTVLNRVVDGWIACVEER